MQAQCRIGGAYCPCQGPQASGSEWTLRFHKRHGRNGLLKQTCRIMSNKSPFGSASHLENIGS